MRKIDRRDVIRIMLVLTLVAAMSLAFGAVGRFVPTHKIVQPVYCGSCHPEQVAELSETTHLGKFSYYINSSIRKFTTKPSAYPNARIISGGCVMCHNFWENMKWYGVVNFDLQPYDGDIPSIGELDPSKDIYGNEVSPYGLGSTKEYYMNITQIADYKYLVAEPWRAGLNNYSYKTADGLNHTRLDYVWSKLSSVSPGPVGYVRINQTTGAQSSCAGGSVEHGMCHIATSAVVLAYADKKNEVMNYSTDDEEDYIPNFVGEAGKGIFFTHEMAFTTAQYAAKPVKICGACHVLKLPPMQWGGEPWAIVDIKKASGRGGDAPDPTDQLTFGDPFGFRPTYNDLTGEAGQTMQRYKNYREADDRGPSTASFRVAFRTPDWAHANVPCIRCHVHAGINKEMVSDNAN